MKFCKLNGKYTYKKIHNWRIDWEEKSKSKFQFAVKQFLKPYWENYVCYEEMPLAGTRLSVDLVNLTKSIVVEAQGEQHGNYVKHFHRNRDGFIAQIERDERTERWCDLNGLTLVEVYPDDLPKLSEKWFLDNYDIIL